MVLIFFCIILLFSNFSLMNVYYSYYQQKMCFVSRDEGVGIRDCSSPFIDSKTEAQSGKDVRSFPRSFIHHSFIHSFTGP